jgi:predicted  nucleic acid-binding Zn-ribbon protein
MYTGQVNRLTSDLASLRSKLADARKRLANANAKALKANDALVARLTSTTSRSWSASGVRQPSFPLR